MKKLKLFFIFAMVLSMLLQTTSIAASTQVKKYSERPTIRRESPDPNRGVGFLDPNDVYKKPSSGIILFSASGESKYVGGICSISRIGVRKIRGGATTMANSIVDKVGYDLEFQRWTGYEWVSIGYGKNYVRNTIDISGYHSVNGKPSVPGQKMPPIGSIH